MSYPAPVLLLPDTVHFKEFYGGYNGTCGETALTAALICALQLGGGHETHDQAVALMLSVTSAMRAKGWASANGASTLWSLAQEAKAQGATINTEWDYEEPMQKDWHQVLLANAGYKPIVLQVGQAFNLKGQDGTGNDEAGVHYHFICVVGKCADGYICMDGDNWIIEQELVVYSYATLMAADICGLLMLDVTGTPAKGNTMAIPTGWKDDGSVLTAPNGSTVVKGFRTYVIDHNPQWPANLVPVDEEAVVATGTEQRFALNLEWDSAKNVVSEADGVVPVPPVPADQTAEINALKAQIAALKTATTNISQVLGPIASVEDALAAAMKAAGF